MITVDSRFVSGLTKRMMNKVERIIFIILVRVKTTMTMIMMMIMIKYKQC